MAYLSMIADLLMIAAAAGAGVYCLILSRRLTRLTGFDTGIGGAIAVLSAQVDEMKAALAEARVSSDSAGRHLHELIVQAREISGELELMIAACHDFAEQAITVQDGALPAGVQAETDTPPPAEAAPPGPADAAQPVFGTRRAQAAVRAV
jgi:hypothetical protein